MKCRQVNLAVLTVATVFALQLEDLSSQAGVVRYSWSGVLLPIGDDDPWQIGEQGQPFELDIGVARDADDLFELNVEFAAHEILYASLILDGQEPAFVGNGIIDFTDGGLIDLLVFQGDFERLGHAIEIGSAVALPVETFSFSRLVEPPPFFDSTVNVDNSGFTGRGPYKTEVAAGASVTVAPEPASIALLIASGLCFVVTRYAVRKEVMT